jgi:hypothetical protein
MEWEGWSNWPPVCPGLGILPTGEEGVLVKVEIGEADNILPLTHLVLTIEHHGTSAPAVLCCDDEETIPRLFEILKGHIGWEVSRIGDLDVDL